MNSNNQSDPKKADQRFLDLILWLRNGIVWLRNRVNLVFGIIFFCAGCMGVALGIPIMIIMTSKNDSDTETGVPLAILVVSLIYCVTGSCLESLGRADIKKETPHHCENQ